MYVVEEDGVLILTLSIGSMTEWVDTVPVGAFQRIKVWYVDENTGEAVRVLDATH